MARQTIIIDDVTALPLASGEVYYEIEVNEQTVPGIPKYKFYQIKSWDSIVAGIAQIYPNLSGVTSIRITKTIAP